MLSLSTSVKKELEKCSTYLNGTTSFVYAIHSWTHLYRERSSKGTKLVYRQCIMLRCHAIKLWHTTLVKLGKSDLSGVGTCGKKHNLHVKIPSSHWNISAKVWMFYDVSGDALLGYLYFRFVVVLSFFALAVFALDIFVLYSHCSGCNPTVIFAQGCL